MRKKILLIFSCVFMVCCIMLLTALPCFALSGSLSPGYVANIPGMDCLYFVQGQTSPGRFSVYGLSSGASSSASYSNSANISPSPTVSYIDYTYQLYYAGENVIDFGFLPINTADIFQGDTLLYDARNCNIEFHYNYFNIDASALLQPVLTIRIEYFDSNMTSKYYNLVIPKNASNPGVITMEQINQYIPDLYAVIAISAQFDYRQFTQTAGMRFSMRIDNINNLTYNFDQVSENISKVSSYKGLSPGILDSIRQEGYDEGYDYGYDYGYSDGYDRGEDSGIDIGYEAGYSDGEYYGYNVGLDEGYDNGFTVGNEQGYSNGYIVGYDDGYFDGQNDLLDSQGFFEFIVKSFASIFNMPLGEHFTLGGLLSIAIAVPVLLFILKLLRG